LLEKELKQVAEEINRIKQEISELRKQDKPEQKKIESLQARIKELEEKRWRLTGLSLKLGDVELARRRTVDVEFTILGLIIDRK